MTRKFPAWITLLVLCVAGGVFASGLVAQTQPAITTPVDDAARTALAGSRLSFLNRAQDRGAVPGGQAGRNDGRLYGVRPDDQYRPGGHRHELHRRHADGEH